MQVQIMYVIASNEPYWKNKNRSGLSFDFCSNHLKNTMQPQRSIVNINAVLWLLHFTRPSSTLVPVAALFMIQNMKWRQSSCSSF